ncbi:U4/U6-U5 snRNP complex subunit LSM8 [Cryptotrichosporon argae]
MTAGRSDLRELNAQLAAPALNYPATGQNGSMSALEAFADHLVQVILYDGRIIVGRLKGNDNHCNLILSDCVEREYSIDQGVEMVPLGLYMIKGDNVAVIAEIDEDKDATLDYGEIRAEPLGEVRY